MRAIEPLGRDELIYLVESDYGGDWDALAADVAKHPATLNRYKNEREPIPLDVGELMRARASERRFKQRLRQPRCDRLAGRKIMVAEDEVITALHIRAVLEECGATVVGPVYSLPLALGVAEGHELDAAVLDVQLGRERVFPAATTLLNRRIPFVFATAFASNRDRGEYPPALRDIPSIRKPFDAEELANAVRLVLRESALT